MEATSGAVESMQICWESVFDVDGIHAHDLGDDEDAEDSHGADGLR